MANYNIDAIYNGSTSLPGTERIRIDGAGNVGIGTTSPGYKLEVSGTGFFSSNLTANGVTIGASDVRSSSNILTLGGTSEIIRITGGNVGIGTTSPAARLQLGTLASVSTATPETISLGGTFSNSAGSNIKLKVYDDGTSIGGMSVSSGQMEVNTWSSGKIAFYRGTTQCAIIADNGNVGIGTTSPIAKLHVSGSTMMMGDSGTFRPRQTIVGNVTGAASTTYKKIFASGHTSTGIINVTAIITAASTASATATFSFAAAFGNSATPNRLSYISLNSTITSIDCQYNNTGYQMEIAVTYTGATAPTLYFTAEGLGSSNWAY